MTETTATRSTGPKRILVTGGAGHMASFASRPLAKADEVDQLIVADRDLESATALASELGPKAIPLELDISDADALTCALEDVDIVLNTAGPYYRFGPLVLRAAIATRTNYLDLCDDWEPTREMLELDDAARAAGITAVIGMGSSPGTGNLLAQLAMNECDTVDRIYTAWRFGPLPRPVADGEEEPHNAALDHWVHNCTAPIKIWRGGELITSDPLEQVTLNYPGIGEGHTYVCGHPEPLTLGRARPGIQESLNLMNARPGLIAGIKRVAARVHSGELDLAGAAYQILREENVRGPAAGPEPILPNLFALAHGTKDGKAVRVGARPIVVPNTSMGEMTGYPLAIASLMMARGQVDKPGVHAPEGAVDAEIYFHELSLLVEDRPDVPVVEVVSESI